MSGLERVRECILLARLGGSLRASAEADVELDRAERIVATVDRNLEGIFAPDLSYAEAQRRAYIMAEELDPDRAREAAHE